MDFVPHLPFLTEPLAGCGGLLKQVPEDFVVEEIPAYPPSGSGEHLFVLVEKRGITTAQLLKHAGQTLGLHPARLGYAGKKDAHTISRQWISLHTSQEPPLEKLESPEISVLRVERHGNKLRRGHLRGNRFQVVVRECAPPPDFAGLWRHLVTAGFPNFFGPQRFGALGDNAREGARLVRAAGRLTGNLQHVRFLINAYQSALFNELVAKRITERGRLDEVLPGDLAIFRESGSFFSVDEQASGDAQARAEKGEISASSPLFGFKTPLAGGLPGEWERALLAAQALEPSDFKRSSKKLSQSGERRAVRAFPDAHSWRTAEREGAPCLELDFVLRPGVYATSFLRELMKNDDLSHQLPVPELGQAQGAQRAHHSA